MKELAGPFELLPGCRLWLAVFAPHDESSKSLDVLLSDAQLSADDFSRWQQYRVAEKRQQFLNSRRVVQEVISSESKLQFAAEQRREAACGFSHGEGICQTSQSRGAATESLAESLRYSGQRRDGFGNARSGDPLIRPVGHLLPLPGEKGLRECMDRHDDDFFAEWTTGAATANEANGLRLKRRGSAQSAAAAFAADRNVHFCNNASGRPLVIDPAGKELFSISLSHSGNVVAVAVSDLPDRIGVDVEVMCPLNEAALLNSAATTEEAAWIRVQPASVRAELLRTLWVIKESVWKTALNSGEMSLADVCVSVDDRLLKLCPLPTNNPHHAWQTALFVLNCAAVLDDTATIVHPFAGGVAVRGCLARRHNNLVTSADLTEATR